MAQFRWTEELIRLEAKKYTIKSDFLKKSASAANAAIRMGIYEDVVKDMPVWKRNFGEDNPAFKWTFEMLVAEALKYNTRSEFQDKSPKAYKVAYTRKILGQVAPHMPERVDSSGENNPSYKWTNEELAAEALKYQSKGQFREGNRKAYNAAHDRGIIPEICTHMPDRIINIGEANPNFKWTLEFILIEAVKYATRTTFARGNPGAYQAAKDRDDYDQICIHMERNRNSSIAEKELLAVIEQKYPSAKKKRDMKVKIEGKPYIKGFELDIFVKELGKAIEFDGIYYHSFEFMRKCKGKKEWSDEDIRNYHEIKDAWFSAKGIKILHINEADWILNKQVCIDKCFEFLKS